MKKLKELIPYIVIVIVVILIRTFLFTPIVVNGTSMSPTLNGNEIMILNKVALKFHQPQRYQVVVLKENNSYLIKRIIGLPKERIKCVNGKIFINDKQLDDRFASGVTEDFDEIKIAKDMYFVLGDNRVVSKDSRSIGPVRKDELKGRTNLVLFPFKKLGFIE